MLVVLLGPKGAGKSHVGGVLERELGIPFLRVEPIFVAARAAGRSDEEALADVEREIAGRQSVAIESTGAAPFFAAFLARQRALREVRVVRVRAPLDVCLARVRRRDPSGHLPAPDELVARVHAISTALDVDAATVIDNGVERSDDEIARALRRALASARR